MDCNRNRTCVACWNHRCLCRRFEKIGNGAVKQLQLDSFGQLLEAGYLFAKAGGMITFSLEGDKVRFEIEIDSAEQAGLKISAQLQKLAKTIRKKS